MWEAAHKLDQNDDGVIDKALYKAHSLSLLARPTRASREPFGVPSSQCGVLALV